jgi:glycosyltransferase involved in cell wall biosynthesis
MRVLLAATSYPRDGGDWKGRFIYDQAAALARPGVAVSLWTPPGELPPGVESALQGDDADWLAGLLDAGGIAHLLRRRPFAGVRAGLQLLRRLRRACRLASADIYLINWLQNALALPDDGKPAIVTVLGSDFRLLDLPGMCYALRGQFRQRATLLAPNAGWMVPRLERLFGDLAEIRLIPFGVDARWFAIDRKLAEPRRWLVVSRLTPDKIGDLFEWGDGLFGAGRELHLFGPMQETVSVPDWVHYHGATHPTALRDEWFPQAAGLITLSRHDEGRPQVMLEAMAAGLPVIASDLPAHRDLIRHRETGWLIGSREEFRPALEFLETPEHNQRIGQVARGWIKATIGDWDDCAARYAAGYESLLK